MTLHRKTLISVLIVTGLSVVGASIWFLVTREGGEVVPTFTIDGEAGANRKSIRLPLPDQPFWKGRMTGDYYGLKKNEFVSRYWMTKRLGEPRRAPDGQTVVEPFTVAALPWQIDSVPEGAFEEVVIIERVVRLLREARVFTAANPVILSVPMHKEDPESWEGEDREPWIGVPVPDGTEVPPPLRLISFPGGEVVAGEPQRRVGGKRGDWGALVERARSLGREPDFPLMTRYSGWQTSGGPSLEFQNVLLLKPRPGNVPPPPSP